MKKIVVIPNKKYCEKCKYFKFFLKKNIELTLCGGYSSVQYDDNDNTPDTCCDSEKEDVIIR